MRSNVKECIKTWTHANEEYPLQSQIDMIASKYYPKKKRVSYAKTQAEAHETLKDSRAKTISRRLTPIHYLNERTVTNDIALKVTRDAARQDLPILCDVLQTVQGREVMDVLHYNFSKDLTIAERTVVNNIVRVAAQRFGMKLIHNVMNLQFDFVPLREER